MQDSLDRYSGMERHCKLFEHIMMKRGDANIPFVGLCELLSHLGFRQRIKGDHHIFSMQGIEEIINLQPVGGKARLIRSGKFGNCF